MAKPLYKSTIVIWTDFDPSNFELDDLATQAVSGVGYCSMMNCDLIEKPEEDPDWDGTEFFGEEDSEDSSEAGDA